jgi:hypothetical protein
MGRACGMYEDEKKCVQGLEQKPREKSALNTQA